MFLLKLHNSEIRNFTVQHTAFPKYRAADSSCRAFQGMDFNPLACSDCGFETHKWHGFSYLLNVVSCQVAVSAMSWSLAQNGGH